MIDYPTYMQTTHQFWLDGTGSGVATGGVALRIANALAANPFSSLTAYDPSTDTTAMTAAVASFSALVTAMTTEDYEQLYADASSMVDLEVFPDEYIAAKVTAHATMLDNEVNTKVLPRFNAGMRDINAVMSSAFVIGQAIIEMDRNEKVEKFATDLRLQADSQRGSLIHNAASELFRLYLQKMEFQRVIAAMTLDEKRLKIAAQNDYKTETKAIEADEARWPLEVYKYGANMLAAIGGGTTGSVPVDGNKTARMIGSGLSGAVAGAQIGGAITNGSSAGTGYGALIGGLAGLLGGA